MRGIASHEASAAAFDIFVFGLPAVTCQLAQSEPDGNPLIGARCNASTVKADRGCCGINAISFLQTSTIPCESWRFASDVRPVSDQIRFI